MWCGVVRTEMKYIVEYKVMQIDLCAHSTWHGVVKVRQK